MKKIIYTIIWYILSSNIIFAAADDSWTDWGILWSFAWDETEEKLKTWDIHLSDIPIMLKWAIDFLMWIAWTIAIIFIIIWAYKILFGSLEHNKTKWKDTIIMAIFWFAIASLAWFIIKFIIDNLS